MGEYSGTGILYSTSEPQHAMVELAQWPPFLAPSLHRCVACVTTTQANDSLGATDCQDCLWPWGLLLPVRPRNLQTHSEDVSFGAM